ncbi:hypothetical protein QOZ80_1BG0078150 [Eleusine coracana subsp. coracana]|nr:hypothetical protein QOZ80_1BG0078150 [Eleusine coracana subsp. coracana]
MASCKATTSSSEADGGVIDTVASINSKLLAGEAVLESLRQLQAVPMTFHVLDATKVGRTVNALRKSAPSEQARELAAKVYRRWRALADEHLRSSRYQAPVSPPTDDVVSEQKPPPTASPVVAPPNPKALAAAAKSVRWSLPSKAKPPSSSSACRRKEAATPTSTRDVATVKKQRSAQPSGATRKAEQPDAAIRQRVAAVPKPAPASKPKGGSDKKASLPATAKLPAAAPPKSNGSGSSARKRKEAPTTTAGIDEARFAMVKRRLQERYKAAADAKEKRRIQVINEPGKATQRNVSLGGTKCSAAVISTVKRAHPVHSSGRKMFRAS